MSWTDGTDRATGYLVTAAEYNLLFGASGSLMQLKSHAHGGTTGEGSTSIGPLTYASFGATPAQSGAVRLTNNTGIVMRNNAGGADITLINMLGVDNNLYLWDDLSATMKAARIRAADGTGHVGAGYDYWTAT